MLGRYGPTILAGGVLMGVGYAYLVNKPPTAAGAQGSSVFRTPGVQNVENAYKRGGATATHTKGYGGTIQGDKEETMRDDSGTAKPLGHDHDHIGEDQRPVQGNAIGKQWNEMQYGSEKGK